MNRIFELLLTLILLTVFLPLMIIIFLIIALKNKLPIFKQERVGKDKEIFIIYKFRTVYNGKIDRFGELLRRTYLDELPQFFNILKGDMSLIGPRPLSTEDDERFRNIKKWEKRVAVKPGLTGLAQIKNYRGDAVKKLQYDLEYIQERSMLMDLKILAKTVWKIIRFKNG